MKGYIDGIDFYNLDAQLYYAPPSSWSKEKKKERATSRIFSGEWYGALKRDGAYYMFIKDEDGNMYLRGRRKSVSGEYLNKIDWVPHLHNFFNSLPNGTCLLGELYLPSKEEAKATTSIMNCKKEKAIERQKKEKLRYYIFDILADEGKSVIKKRAEDRFDLLNSYWRAYGEDEYEWAEYYTGRELWDKLSEYLANGNEGIVITHKDAPYQPGKRPSKDCLKVKKEMEDPIDCVIIGVNAPTKIYSGKEIEDWTYWYDERSNQRINKKCFEDYENGATIVPVTKSWYNKWAGSLKLGAYKDGAMVQIGNLSGITDEMKENWTGYLYKVCEVSAMEIMTSNDGSKGIRHPKFLRIREDKAPEDCKYELIFA